jgi:hypothetical protein
MGNPARTRAQAKRRASAPAKSNRQAAQKQTAAKPAKPRQSGEEALAAAIGLEETPHGEHVCEVEHNAGAWQTLYRRGEDEFTLVNTCMAVHDGRYWRTWEEWSERHPGILLSSLPSAKVRRHDIPEKLHRGEVIAWLWENFGFVAIPADFADDFRPHCIVKSPAKAALRESFLELAHCVMKDCRTEEDTAAAAFDVMNVAAALGFKDEAQRAAMVTNCHNASTVAANALHAMLEAGLKSES